MGYKQGYKQIPESQWDYAACDNPKCPQHPINGGIPPEHYPKFSNGEKTLCDVCVEEVD